MAANFPKDEKREFLRWRQHWAGPWSPRARNASIPCLCTARLHDLGGDVHRVARRTDADRLFISPLGHAVHDAGSHAKDSETASSKPTGGPEASRLKTRPHTGRAKRARPATRSKDRREGRRDSHRLTGSEVGGHVRPAPPRQGSQRARETGARAPFTTRVSRGAKPRPRARSSQHGPTYSTRTGGREARSDSRAGQSLRRPARAASGRDKQGHGPPSRHGRAGGRSHVRGPVHDNTVRQTAQERVATPRGNPQGRERGKTSPEVRHHLRSNRDKTGTGESGACVPKYAGSHVPRPPRPPDPPRPTRRGGGPAGHQRARGQVPKHMGNAADHELALDSGGGRGQQIRNGRL
jgi:hypothetical protein